MTHQRIDLKNQIFFITSPSKNYKILEQNKNNPFGETAKPKRNQLQKEAR